MRLWWYGQRRWMLRTSCRELVITMGIPEEQSKCGRV